MLPPLLLGQRCGLHSSGGAGGSLARSASTAGLRGLEIIGSGDAYTGARTYDKAWDGDVETFFDCTGADSCYSGVQLPAATTIGTVRFYPRGNCGGCGVPGCAGDSEQGACRMVGGTFEGSNSQSGPWMELFKITTKPVEKAWTSVHVASAQSVTFFRYKSAPGGHCNIAEVQIFPSSRWGWTVVGLIVGGAGAYLAVGAAMRFQKGKRGTELLPRSDWQAIHGLVQDGFAFTMGGQRHDGNGRRGQKGVPSSAYTRGGSKGRSPPKKTSKKHSRTKDQRKRSGEAHVAFLGDSTPPALPRDGQNTWKPTASGMLSAGARETGVKVHA
eukprot:COSAG01_NODE_5359_length_4310_cov_55.597720_4_plen_328_part_00